MAPTFPSLSVGKLKFGVYHNLGFFYSRRDLARMCPESTFGLIASDISLICKQMFSSRDFDPSLTNSSFLTVLLKLLFLHSLEVVHEL